MALKKELLEILCCPETKADLVYENDFLISTDRNSRRKYRVENDIPIMLIEESTILSENEWNEIMKRNNKL